jgi:FkbM family methyltransferase
MTGYVIEEQSDWFEDEIRFVRALLRGGERVVDAGANHGAYALTMARQVGPGGRVHAIEPAAKTAGRLAASASANGFSQLEVIRAAVSDSPGTATFYTGTSSELSSLSRDNGRPVGTERVRVTTLDLCAADGGWRDICFVKLDVEGEEIRALEGARAVLDRWEPLLMVEHKHGADVNERMYEWLAAEGHILFRLVPGLNILVPHPPGTRNDPYLLNTFAARPGRIAELERAGLLAREIAPEDLVPPAKPWRDVVGSFPAIHRLGETASFSDIDEGQSRHRLAIERWGLALREDLPAPVRARCLKSALDLSSASLREDADIGRMMTFARLAAAWGERGLAVEALRTAILVMTRGRGLVAEPFLPPSPRFDAVDPGRRFGAWALTALHETAERMRAYSSYFTYRQPDTLRNLELIERLGFQGPEMAQRLYMVREMAAVA